MFIKLKHYVKRAFTLPPQVVLQKLLFRGKTRWKLYWEKQADRHKSTYACYKAKLHRLVSLPQEIPPVTNDLFAHCFDLLGSGLVNVKYGMQAKGLEGHLYSCQIALHLAERINSANIKYAKKVAGLIDPSYVPIDWQIDFKSGYRWQEKTHSHKVQYGHLPGIDIKVPWELARMQHLPQLAWGYAASKEKKFVREFRNQILDFIANNPPRFGVNWSCTMDVGIRIANWLVGYDLLLGYGAQFDSEFEAIFISSVYDHGSHIINHLERTVHFRSNHYLANITGLLFVASYLPSTDEIDGWLNFSIEELRKEVAVQFHEDGSSFEGSTSYHCLSAQIVAYATGLALAKGKVDCFPKWYYERLSKMAEFVAHITKPNGNIIQVGDHDSGYLFRLFPPYDNHLNRQFLVDELRLKSLFKQPIPIDKENRPSEKCVLSDLSTWKRKLKLLKQTTIAFPCVSGHLTLHAYPDFGLYIYCSPRLFLSVRAGYIGQWGQGGHAHNDQLSVELVVDDAEIVVDPGTYLYTPLPERRNDYRSVKAHFAPQIAGREPSGLKNGVFVLSKDPKGECLHFDRRGFLGVHTGYGFPVYRLVEIKPKEIEITDFSAGEELVPMHQVFKSARAMPFSPGYGIIR
ncbi:MAG: heparinase II/III family protein [Chlamydiota bacterium]